MDVPLVVGSKKEEHSERRVGSRASETVLASVFLVSLKKLLCLSLTPFSMNNHGKKGKVPIRTLAMKLQKKTTVPKRVPYSTLIF